MGFIVEEIPETTDSSLMFPSLPDTLVDAAVAVEVSITSSGPDKGVEAVTGIGGGERVDSEFSPISGSAEFTIKGLTDGGADNEGGAAGATNVAGGGGNGAAGATNTVAGIGSSCTMTIIILNYLSRVSLQ